MVYYFWIQICKLLTVLVAYFGDFHQLNVCNRSCNILTQALQSILSSFRRFFPLNRTFRANNNFNLLKNRHLQHWHSMGYYNGTTAKEKRRKTTRQMQNIYKGSFSVKKPFNLAWISILNGFLLLSKRVWFL